MNYEEQARKNHKSGFNCAQSVFVAFAQELGMSPVEAMQAAPKPRSEGGKCGGQAPVSPLRVCIAILLALALAFGIFYAVGGLEDSSYDDVSYSYVYTYDIGN